MRIDRVIICILAWLIAGFCLFVANIIYQDAVGAWQQEQNILARPVVRQIELPDGERIDLTFGHFLGRGFWWYIVAAVFSAGYGVICIVQLFKPGREQKKDMQDEQRRTNRSTRPATRMQAR